MSCVYCKSADGGMHHPACPNDSEWAVEIVGRHSSMAVAAAMLEHAISGRLVEPAQAGIFRVGNEYVVTCADYRRDESPRAIPLPRSRFYEGR